MFWFAGLHPLNKIFQGQQDIYLVWGGGSNAKMFFVQEHYIADPGFPDYAKASLLKSYPSLHSERSKGFSENMEIRIWKAFSQLQLSLSLQPREALSQSMIINDNQRQSMTINDNQWCGTSDTSDTSHTANSSDASKASASVTRLLSYLLLPLCYIYGKQCWPISFNQFSNNRNFCRR